MDNNNAKPEIEKILRTCLENLRELAHTPSEPQPPDRMPYAASGPLAKILTLPYLCCRKAGVGFLAGVLGRWGWQACHGQ